MIREVVGVDIPARYYLKDDVGGYQSFLLEQHQSLFRQAAVDLGFLGCIEGLWLREEALRGESPTHFLLERVTEGPACYRYILEEHRNDLPYTTPAQVVEALKSRIQLYRFTRRIGKSYDLDAFEEYLDEVLNPRLPVVDRKEVKVE